MAALWPSDGLYDETGATCAAFLQRAAAYFAAKGIVCIERVMTDNRSPVDMPTTSSVCVPTWAHPEVHPTHCPWQNSKLGPEADTC